MGVVISVLCVIVVRHIREDRSNGKRKCEGIEVEDVPTTLSETTREFAHTKTARGRVCVIGNGTLSTEK